MDRVASSTRGGAVHRRRVARRRPHRLRAGRVLPPIPHPSRARGPRRPVRVTGHPLASTSASARAPRRPSPPRHVRDRDVVPASPTRRRRPRPRVPDRPRRASPPSRGPRPGHPGVARRRRDGIPGAGIVVVPVVGPVVVPRSRAVPESSRAVPESSRTVPESSRTARARRRRPARRTERGHRSARLRRVSIGASVDAQSTLGEVVVVRVAFARVSIGASTARSTHF